MSDVTAKGTYHTNRIVGEHFTSSGSGAHPNGATSGKGVGPEVVWVMRMAKGSEAVIGAVIPPSTSGSCAS